jgi:ATP-dependent Clp protease ATP-binding subunit ClpC
MHQNQSSPRHAEGHCRGTLGQSEAFCRDLTAAALDGRFRRFVLRQVVHDRLVALLSKKDKPTVVLTGRPGVGKSSNVYALADRMANSREMPTDLQDMRFLELDVPAFLAGASTPGELERRALGLCRDAAAAGRSILMFIDEAHLLLQARAGASSLGDILKPALARGEICCIAATTDAGYRSFFEADDALARRFQRVDVPEPDEQETTAILVRSVPALAGKHGLFVTREDISRAVRLSCLYVRLRANPDKSNDLLDEAMALQRVQYDRTPGLRAGYQARLGRQAADARLAGDPAEADRLEAIATALAEGGLPFDSQFLGEVVHRWTGLPAEVLGGHASALGTFMDRVRRGVVGQDRSVGLLVDAILRGLTGASRTRGPLASAFMVGPTGTGKTETARVIAREILGRPDAMFRIDGSEFVEPHAVSRLIGSPPGYVGFERGGDLTAFVRDHHFGVIVFDEFEKADGNAHDLFLQILEEGELQDGRGMRVDFSGQIVLFTSNIGAEADEAPTVGYGASRLPDRHIQAPDDRAIRARLAAYLRPEFVNRLDVVLHFRQLDRTDIRRIAQLIATDFTRRLREERRLDVVIDDRLLDQIAARADEPGWGGREVRRVFDRLVTQPVASWMLANPMVHAARIVLTATAEEGR